MNVLGITLRTPDKGSLVAPLLAVVIGCGVFTLLALNEVIKPINGAMLCAAAIGGGLAYSYGASIKNSGWRGAVISTIFSVLLVGLVYLFWQFINSE